MMFSDPQTISFSSESQLSVKQLNDFLTGLQRSYNRINGFMLNPMARVQTLAKKSGDTVKFIYKVSEPKFAYPMDELAITIIHLNSPGFFEFLGNINPLKFLKDCYVEYNKNERWKKEFGLKQKDFALKAELTRMKIVREKVEFLREMGVPEANIQELILAELQKPAFIFIAAAKNNGFKLNGIENLDE